MDKTDSSDIAVYVVWSPQLRAKEKHALEAAELIPDKRAQHYWDPDMAVGGRYQELRLKDGTLLNLGSPAWDVWLVFGPDARWDSEPPEPVWWEHQLGGLPHALRLDPERFAAKANELVSGQAASARASEAE